jgi:hypothetical protein
MPRAGSTLVQRVLATNPEIATTAEPWLLLPHLYARRGSGARADYWHEGAARAVSEFVARLPGGEEAYDAELRDFAERLYSRAAGDATYFLDKTPHYHLVVGEIARIFPEARLIFLWRNPLAVLASLLETFRGGRFEPYHFKLDLYDGVVNLTTSWRELGARACAVRYEDLVRGDEKEWRRLFGYLELDFDPGQLTAYREVDVAGVFGDPNPRAYDSLSAESVLAWRRTLAGLLRRAWSRRYLRWIGESRLSEMGYDMNELLAELSTGPRSVRIPGNDLFRLASSRVAACRRARALRLPETPKPRGPTYS